MRIEPGQVFGGKYKIIGLLGEGGMGAVYEGENARIHRKVAIKVLHTGLVQNADVVKRFEREAQAAGRIGSRHIVEVLDLGELEDGTRYMVLEFLEGETLERRIKTRGRMSVEEVVPIMHQLLEGLGAAHQAGIIHRDLKPANVYLLPTKMGIRDFVKILDFGVSKFNVLGGDEAMSMTRTGAVMGTPFYMSPEQAKGSRSIDARSDLYAVGVILYECITGQVPFSAETFNELMFKIVLESPPPPESFVPHLNPAMGAVVRRAMAREPADRFQTVVQFQQALAEIGGQQTYQGHPGNPATQSGAYPQANAPGTRGGGQAQGQVSVAPAPFPGQAAFNAPGRASNPDLQAGALGRVSSPPTPYPGGRISGTDPRSFHDSGSAGMRNTEAPAESVVIPKKNSGLIVTLVVVAGVLIGGGVFGALRWRRATTAIDTPVPAASPEATATTAATTTAATSAAPVASATEAPTSEPTTPPSASAAPTEEPGRITAWKPPVRSSAGAGSATPTAAPTVAPTVTPTATPSTKSTGRTVSTAL